MAILDRAGAPLRFATPSASGPLWPSLYCLENYILFVFVL